MNKKGYIVLGLIIGILSVAGTTAYSQYYNSIYPSAAPAGYFPSGADLGDSDLTNVGSIYADALVCDADPNTYYTAQTGGSFGHYYVSDGATGPLMFSYHQSASPADGDISKYVFYAKDSTNASLKLGEMSAEIQDHVDGSEESIMRFKVVDGTGTQKEYMRFDGTDNIQSVVYSKDVKLEGTKAYYTGTQTSDTTPNVCTMESGDAYPKASAGANSTGSNLLLAAGSGAQYITVTAYATSAADTLTFYVVNASGLTTTVKTADAGGWTCSATSNADCALSLSATTVSGILFTCTDGTCSDGKVFVNQLPGVTAVYIVAADAGGGGVFGTVTMGANGIIKTYGLNTTNGGLAVCNAYNQCTYRWVDSSNDAKPGIYSHGTLAVGGGYAGLEFVDSAGTGLTHAFGTRFWAASGINGVKPYVVTTPSSVIFTNANNSTQTETYRSKTCTFAGGGGGATCVTSGLILDGELVNGIVGRITTSSSPGCTTVSVGDGTDPDRYSSDISSALGTTFTPALATAESIHTALANEEVTVTATAGGNCVSVVVTVIAYIKQLVAPTS